MAAFARVLSLLALVFVVSACSIDGPSDDTGGGTPQDTGGAQDVLDAEEDTGGGLPDISIDLGGGGTDAEVEDATDGGDADATDGADSADIDAVDVPGDTTSSGISCTPGVTYCVGDVIRICDATGQGYQPGGTDCANQGLECKDAVCVAKKVCEPNGEYCQNGNPHKCNETGTAGTQILACESGEVCFVGGTGKAACVPKICEPAQPVCAGEVLTVCNASGSAAEPGGTDCAKTGESCVDKDGTPVCAAPTCGDGKVNAESEECDLGADNGKLGKTCDENCKASSGKCVSPADCQGLGGSCIASYLCVSGQCLAIAKTVGGCDDGDACTIGDHCVQGLCVGVAKSCDDGDPCTLDSCAPATGCVNKGQNGVPCDDGNDCTVGDKCAAGACQSGLNACGCSKDEDCAGYDDGDPCNGVMACLSGTCEPKPGSVVQCGEGVCVRGDNTKGACTDAGGVWTGVLCIEAKAKSQVECNGAKGIWQANSGCLQATCSTTLAICVPEAAIDFKACDDGDACTAPDLCSAGKCAGKAADCDDDNPCTDDSCDPKQGCVHKPNTTPCDDADASTAGDKCAAGVCKGTAILDCTEDKDCASDAQSQNLCAGKLVCDKGAGKCKLDLATVVTCDPALGSACAPVSCDPADGKCKATELDKGTPCDDGDACTTADACEGGSCKGGAAPSCDDGNACTDDTCNPALGCVSSPNAAACDDGQPCTKGDICKGGACTPGDDTCQCIQDSDCAAFGDGNKCKGDWFCSKLANKCTFDASKAVVCAKGVCSNAQWTDATQCANSGGTWSADSACQATACDPADGTCKATFAADGKPCNDGSPCTISDTCKGGACTSVPNPCNDGNPCTDADCSPTQPGGCLLGSAALEGKECSDGNSCTEGDLCQNGGCKGGKLVDCDDGKPCTADACLPGKGCVHPAGSGPCDDGDACTTEDTCDGVFGKCEGGKPKNCVDANACTDDSCDSEKGGCVFSPNDKPCNNGDPCSFGDFCAIGLCKAGTPTDCDDDNLCTADACDSKIGCTHEHQDGACDDGDACTEGDKCFKSACTGGPKDCNDGNTCTNDACDPKTGCIYTPALGDCGVFATCGEVEGGGQACVFKDKQRVLISEVAVGAPLTTADDFVELHNPTGQQVDLGDYALQQRSFGSSDTGDWADVLVIPKNTTIAPGGYLLVGGSQTVFAGRKADLVASALALTRDAGALRLHDKAHNLEHDAIRWGGSACDQAADAAPVMPEGGSIERRANETATATELSRDGKHWLAGNAWDTGDSSKDFVARLTPEPQGKGFYEPACGGTCGGGKVCNNAGTGKDACVDDLACAYGCGGGQKCNTQVGGCALDPAAGLVLSEVMLAAKSGSEARFVELHNGGKAAIDIGGFVLDLKPAEATVSEAWTFAIAQVPAGVVLEPGAYYLFATQAWAEAGGGVDQIATLALGSTGGTLRIRDPHSGVEFDRFGWGQTKSAAGAGLNIGGGLSAGLSMARKASQSSNSLTMAATGNEANAGNARNTKNNSADWVIMLSATPRTWHGGSYGPACGGFCPSGQVCNFVRGAESCVDPTCNGQCGIAEVCNVKTGKCDESILISQVALQGDALDNPKLLPTENEAIELYNPSDNLVNIGAMVIQYNPGGTSGWQTRTQIFPSGRCVNSKKADCTAGETCTCEGEESISCSNPAPCNATYIAPRSRFLVLPPKHDPKLPKADLTSSLAWAFNTTQGALRLVRTSAKPFPSGDIASDKVAWGEGMTGAGFPKSM
ncbi:MAG: hypothetical protein RIT45_1238, partial [Pseudomonadota bacterium]